MSQLPARSVISLHEGGATIKTIAEVVKLPEKQIKAIIKAHQMGDEKVKKMYIYAESGMSGAEIGRLLGCSRQYVHKMLGNRHPQTGELVPKSTVLVDSEDVDILRKIAEEFGLLIHKGSHSGRGDIGQLMHMIAIRNLHVVKTKHF